MIKSKCRGKIRVLFVYYSLSSFVKSDLEILQKHFDVTTIQWHGKRDLPKIALGVLKSDLTFSWFAGDHAAVAVFFSKLFRKKSIVIAGGGDVAYVPEIDYGQFTLGWHKQMLTKFALKYADMILAVSEFTKNEILDRFIEKFKPKKEKENIIVTVGGATKKGIKLKGLETFAKVSAHFSDYKFVIIGETEDFGINKLKRNNKNLLPIVLH
jgi:hypothetical protein